MSGPKSSSTKKYPIQNRSVIGLAVYLGTPLKVKNRSVIGLPRHPESLRTDLSYLFMLQKVLGQMTHRNTLANPKNRLDIGRYVPKDQSKVYVASSK